MWHYHVLTVTFQAPFTTMCTKCNLLRLSCVLFQLTEVTEELKAVREKEENISNTSLNSVEPLEEELVVLKEQYASVIEEKMALNRDLVRAQEQYAAMCNRSYNTLFLYIAPLVLMALYILISHSFSWLTAIYFLFFYLCYKFFIRIINATT